MKRTSRYGNAVQGTAGWCEAADIRIKKSPQSWPPNYSRWARDSTVTKKHRCWTMAKWAFIINVNQGGNAEQLRPKWDGVFLRLHKLIIKLEGYRMSKLMVTERLTLRQLEFDHAEALGREWCSSTGRVKDQEYF